MNKVLFLLSVTSLLLFQTHISHASSWAEFLVETPSCFGADTRNMTSSIKNIIACLNVKSTDAKEGKENEAALDDIVNMFGINLAANAIATRTILFEESQKEEKSYKSANKRETTSNETQGQIKDIAERFDAIIKMESSIQIFDAMLKIRDLPYSEY